MKNPRYHMNIGGASIILLIAVFGLTVFAVLSIRASYKERQMAQKNREAVEAYYEADARAEEIFAQVANKWEDAGRVGSAQAVLDALKLSEEMEAKVAENEISFQVDVDHNRVLYVSLGLDKGGCSVLHWKLVSGTSGSYGESIDLWDGGFTE